MISYQAKICQDKKSFTVSFPDLPGCFSSGKTFEQALTHAKEALSLYLEEARDPKWKLPLAKTYRGKEYYWVTPDFNVAIPLMIRSARHQKKLSQIELAKCLGVSFQQIQKLETPGKSNPTVKTLVAISEALGGEIEIKLVA